MKLIIEKDKLVILSESPQDDAFLELVFDVKKAGDVVQCNFFDRLTAYKNGRGLVLRKETKGRKK